MRRSRALCAGLLGTIAAFGHAAPAPITQLDFSIAIEPASRALRGEGTIEIPAGPAVSIALDKRFSAAEMRWQDRSLRRAPDRNGAWLLPSAASPRKVSVRWEGRLGRLDTSIDHRQTLDSMEPVTGSEGTFLPAAANWYPHVEGMLERWRITLELPPGQRGLVPGRLLDERDDARGYRARFEFAVPAEGIDLMAGPYTITERSVHLGHRSIRLRTWFAPGLEQLVDGYLTSTEDYLRLYEGWIGPYPYTEFSIVSSPTPTGFGMATLTYLGVDVLRLPFIRATSLGHEVLHNWWGNGVYPDYARGNWSEGLTTFMADYHYKLRESDGAARDMRLGWLRDFSAVPPGQDEALIGFTSRTHGTSQIVGYNKAAMLFVMLRDLIGTEAFDRGLREFWNARQFTVASWDDLRAAFENTAARDLAWFFAQWTARAGAPRLRIDRATRERIAGRWRVRATLAQDAPAYRLQVPVAIDTDLGGVAQTIELDALARTVEIDTPGRPRAITIDPDQRLFRRLDADEAPPILRDAFVSAAPRAIVLPDDAAFADAARSLLEKLLDQPPRFERPDAMLDGEPLIVFGTAEDLAQFRARHGFGAPAALPARTGTATVWTERFGGATVVFISARDSGAVAALARPLPHYGKQSWLIFDGGKALERGIWPPKGRGWVFE